MDWFILMSLILACFYLWDLNIKIRKRLEKVENKIDEDLVSYKYLNNFLAFLRHKNVWNSSDYDSWNNEKENKQLEEDLKKQGLFNPDLDKDF
jgi:hypothetical protein